MKLYMCNISMVGERMILCFSVDDILILGINLDVIKEVNDLLSMRQNVRECLMLFLTRRQ